MFIEQSLIDFEVMNEPEDVFQLYKPLVKSESWNAFEGQGPQFVDCDQFKDRKSTGLQVESLWDESLKHDYCQSTYQKEEISSYKNFHKNQTKNIPKNYGKATILYIRNNKSRVKRVLHEFKLNQNQFNQFINYSRSHINTIKEIRSFWTDYKFGKVVRILSFEFMRKHSLKYIFNSRIKNHITHVKYRNKLIDGLKSPESFSNIKDF